MLSIRSCIISASSTGRTAAIAGGAILAALTVPAAAHAQIIAPPAFAAAEAPTFNFAIAHASPFTYQVQFAAAQLAGLTVGQKIIGLSFRLDTAVMPQTAAYTSYTVVMSQAANTITNMSATYTANQLNPVTVYNAALTFAAAGQPSGGSPNAFGPTITFSSAYTYQGGDLVYTISHPASTVGSPSGAGFDAAETSNVNTGYRALASVEENSTTALFTASNVTVTRIVVAPEPETFALMALGMLSMVGRRAIRRRRAGEPASRESLAR